MSHASRKHRRDLAAGRMARSSDVAGGKRGTRNKARLLRVIPGQPVAGDVDPQALAAELAHLVELARRGFST
jgi:hypothetical protein